MVSRPRVQVRKTWSEKVVWTKLPVMTAPGCFGHITGLPDQKARTRSRSCSTSDGMAGGIVAAVLPPCASLHGVERAQEVSPEHGKDLLIRHAALLQTIGQSGQCGGGLQPVRQSPHALQV